MTSESLLTKTMPRSSLIVIWWRVFTGMLSSQKALVEAHARIVYLESIVVSDEITATTALKKVEQMVIKLGDTQKSSKTIRHEILALIDKEFHKEVAKERGES